MSYINNGKHFALVGGAAQILNTDNFSLHLNPYNMVVTLIESQESVKAVCDGYKPALSKTCAASGFKKDGFLLADHTTQRYTVHT